MISNKKVLSTAIAAALGTAGMGASMSAHAVLANGSTLNFPTAATGGSSLPAVGTGSWFSMLVDPANAGTAYTGISDLNGVTLGTSQAASGSHVGGPGCSPINSVCNDGSVTAAPWLPYTENPDIDNAWSFFGNTGMHQSTSNTDVLSASGNTATVDFSGWSVTWNGIANIPMNSGTFGNSNLWSDGVANVVCDTDCGNGDSYILDYRATVPVGDPSGFGGVKYKVHLEGTVSAIPVPAAVWLFGSGLIGLVGVARRRKISA